MPTWAEAGMWGLIAGSALLIGAAVGNYISVPQRVVAAIMAFGGGVLVSALSFDLMDEAYKLGGFDATSIGFIFGATVYTALNIILNSYGAKHRKRSGHLQAKAKEDKGTGLAIALGALLDGIPESIAIGVSLLAGAGVSVAAVIAVFLSNIPEGLSSAAGMKKAGRSERYIFGVWGAIALVSGISAIIGYTVFSRYSADIIAVTIAVAAGGILAMLADTMIPESFEQTHEYTGLITVFGFLLAFILTKLQP